MKLRLALVAATCLALPVAAHAQPVTGPYVSLGAGTTFLTSTNYSFNNGTSGHFLWRPALSGKVSAGYGFGNGFRVEIAGDMFRDTVHKAEIPRAVKPGFLVPREPMG